MKKIGLFYKTDSDKTALVAKKIQQEFGNTIEIVPVENAWEKNFEAYDNLIIGTSTWFDGELPTYWDEMLPELKSLNLKNKKVAIFGLGDQVNYPENFVDGIGIMAEVLKDAGATLVGFTSPKEYQFERSRALKNNKLLGLAIDLENQDDKTDRRVKEWSEQLKKEFK